MNNIAMQLELSLNFIVDIIELNSNILNRIWFQSNYQIKVNNWIKIELKTNEMQIDEKDIQNLLVNMMLGRKIEHNF
jgi:hypothetical protein